MQELKVLVKVDVPDVAMAEEITGRIADIAAEYGGRVDTAPVTIDCSAKWKAAWQAARDAAAAAKAEADRTAVQKVYDGLNASATLDQKAKDAVLAIIEAKTGIADATKETP